MAKSEQGRTSLTLIDSLAFEHTEVHPRWGCPVRLERQAIDELAGMLECNRRTANRSLSTACENAPVERERTVRLDGSRPNGAGTNSTGSRGDPK